MSIVVIGSLNMDMVVRAERAPEAGETLFGQGFALSPGEKGRTRLSLRPGLVRMLR